MAVTYEWDQPDEPTDLEQKTIVASEEVTETKEEKFTIAQKEQRITQIDEQVATLQAEKEAILAKIVEVKAALEIK